MASNPGVAIVEGMEINTQEPECSGWIEVLGRRKRNSDRGKPNKAAPTEEKNDENGGRRTAAPRNVLKRIVDASRIPGLPREHFKTIVRPRGGLDVKKADLILFKRALATAASLSPEQVYDDTLCANNFQNILVVATPFEANARAYARVERILLGGKAVEVAAYVAASDDTCKGVVRGINPDLSEADLTAMVVNCRNPEALGVRRIKRTPTIVVLFEGQKVPKHVYFEGVRYPCTLYRRQVDVCYACGELGHRSDVCPNGEGQKKCRGCGMSSPQEDHQCDPKCSICGGAHQTADRKCRHRFQMPYIVRQRRRRRRRQAQEAQKATGPHGSGAAGGGDAAAGRRASSRRQSASTGRYGSRERSGSRVRSRSRGALRQQSTLPLPGAPTLQSSSQGGDYLRGQGPVEHYVC
ncbi:hypothetical protein MTO96_009162 [Rhipicephalus appendiculatus]